MIVVDVRADMSVALKAAENLQDAVKGKALARALNRAATTVRAQARRDIRARYNIDSKRINAVLRLKSATPGNPDAVVFAKDARLPLSSFGQNALLRRLERQRAGRRTTANIRVKVLRGGAAKVVRGNPNFIGAPFLQQVGKGRHLGIFQRVSASRLPVKELFSVSIPGALTSKIIAEALRKVAITRFSDELKREVQFRARTA